jgi:hypothetical protein
MDLLAGIFIGMVLAGVVWYLSKSRFQKEKTQEQSVILLEKIRNVAKLITVESEFTEIMHYTDTKDWLFNLFKSKKKALVITKSRVMVGFDMRKMRMETDAGRKVLRIIEFPQPEILSIETDVEYYDITHGKFNKFKAEDLTRINQSIKENIRNKIPETGMLDVARSKALDSVHMIEQIVEAFGWKLRYKQLPGVSSGDVKKLEA